MIETDTNNTKKHYYKPHQHVGQTTLLSII